MYTYAFIVISIDYICTTKTCFIYSHKYHWAITLSISKGYKMMLAAWKHTLRNCHITNSICTQMSTNQISMSWDTVTDHGLRSSIWMVLICGVYIPSHVYTSSISKGLSHRGQSDGILPKGPYLPCLRMADRALLAGYPQLLLSQSSCPSIPFYSNFRPI